MLSFPPSTSLHPPSISHILPAANPIAHRATHRMHYRPVRVDLDENNAKFNDLHRFFVANFSWERVEPDGDPAPAALDSPMAYSPDGRLWMFGGMGGGA